jgi:hypothetical protein
MGDIDPSDEITYDVHADGHPGEGIVSIRVACSDGTDRLFTVNPMLAIEIALRIYRSAKLTLGDWKPDYSPTDMGPRK